MNYVLVDVLDIVVSSSLIVRLFSRLIPMLIVTDRVSIYYDLVMTNSWDIILRIGYIHDIIIQAYLAYRIIE